MTLRQLEVFLAIVRARSYRQAAEALHASQPALSQHLSLLREDGLVATRKEAQTVFYRLADQKVARLLRLLRDLYCPTFR